MMRQKPSIFSMENKGRKIFLKSVIVLVLLLVMAWPVWCEEGNHRNLAADLNPVEEAVVPEPVQYVEARDIRIAYREYGPMSGEEAWLRPLVMITGYGGLMEMWPQELIEPLARDRRVIVFDNRGLGYTSCSGRDYSIELFAGDTLALLDALDIERAHVLGWSMGAFIAQELALRHPDRVDALIILAGSYGGEEAVWPDDSVWQTLTDLSGTLEERVQRMFANLFPPVWLQEHPDPSAWFPPVTAPVDDHNLMRQAETLKSWGGSATRLPDLAADTLIIAGSTDRVFPPSNAALLAERIPRATVVIIHDGGHGFFFQYPAYTARVINDFL